MEIYISLGIALASIVGNIIISWFQNRKSIALLEYRLKQLEEKQDKHNQIIERTYKLERDVAVLQEDIKNAKSD